MATPPMEYKITFPSFTKLVADKSGLRVEWTEDGQQLIEQLAAQSPIYKLCISVHTPKNKETFTNDDWIYGR